MGTGRLLVALHDVTPAFETEVRQATSALRDWSFETPALAVIPNHHGRWPLREFPAFCDFLRGLAAAGCEILLHGYEHLAASRSPTRLGLVEAVKARLLTAGEGEFQSLPRADAVERIARGRAEIEAALGLTPAGFLAPAWLEHRETGAAVRSAGLTVHEDHIFVYDVARGRRLVAPALTFTARSPSRVAASIAWAAAIRRAIGSSDIDLRLALHPLDFRSPALVAAIGRVARAALERRRVVGYAELLSPRSD